jgi:hypothetical protein
MQGIALQALQESKSLRLVVLNGQLGAVGLEPTAIELKAQCSSS